MVRVFRQVGTLDQPMPTYEYACKACGEHHEVTQSFSDPPLAECPACGGEVRKVFHPIGVAFKGSGFYKNDSRSAGSKSSTSEAKSETKSETKTESKSESKSETKTESAPKTKSDTPAAS
jgi:putative FmdB family regulatory protein